ncbi:MAG: carotenoid 1,2-hydratase, partial [Granulosicoccus sp.]|nr:carotenoid 1,2-hydratase [Granulosicoccus sp.]
WWYLTAWLQRESGPIGLQITFFRSRTPYGQQNPSRFAPKQLVLAHAALALPDRGALLHDQQAWRAGDPIAQFSTTDTAVVVGLANNRWSMHRDISDQYHINVAAEKFRFAITARPPASIPRPMLQGQNGFSQKGPSIRQASYYYSRPQLKVAGEIEVDGSIMPVDGRGWLDHEWSSELLDKKASGWDWVGLNFHDGSALMAFQMRTLTNEVLYSAARYLSTESGEQKERDLSPRFTAVRHWRSPRTDGSYPVSIRLQAGELDLTIEPLFDDQELDSRGSTGVIYWEGAVSVWHSEAIRPDGSKKSDRIATGYLELTGYAERLRI